MSPTHIEIGKNIQKYRKEKGIKGATLAKSLLVSRAAISQMENGTVDFKISTLHKIALILEIELSHLIYRDTSYDEDNSDDRYKADRHLRTISMLVCRMEYMHEQIETMKSKAVS